MTPVSIQDLIDRLTRSDFLNSDKLRELTEAAATMAAPESLTEFITQRGWMTSFQLDHLLKDQMDQLALGGYRLQEPIGAGGMGEVFRALQVKLHRPVAIKLIRKEFAAAHTDALARFRREALAVAKLAHPNIVVIFDADEFNGTNFIAMEYVTGLDLSKLVKEHGQMPIDAACDCIRQAALGLQHAHENNLVHRDIKPSNLLLAIPEADLKSGTIDYRRAQVKILDLGLARITSDDTAQPEMSLTRERGVMGTPEYISPEQARDPKTADIRSDLYSLGCTFYFLLAGHPPFPKGTALEKVMCHQLERPRSIRQIRPQVPQEVADILRRLLAKRREDRFQTPADLAQALAEHLGMAPRRPAEPPRSEPRPPAKPPAEPTPTVVTQVPQQPEGEQSVCRSMLLSAASALDPAAANSLFEGTVLPGETFSNLFKPGGAGSSHAPPCRIVKAVSMANVPVGEYGSSILPTHCVAVLQGHNAPVVTMAFAKRGKFLATGGLDHSVRVWALDGDDFRQVTAFHDERLGEILGLAFGLVNNSLHVAAGGFGGRVWQWRWQDRVDREMHGLDGSGSSALSVSPDGQHIAAADKGNVSIWKAGTDLPKFRGTLLGRGPEITCTAFAGDGQSLYAGNVQGIVQSWKQSWNKFRPHCAFAAHVGTIYALAASPDGRRVATAGTDNSIRIWLVENEPELIGTISSGLRGVVRRLQFEPEGRSIFTMSDSSQVARWRCDDSLKEGEWRLNQAVTTSQAIADHGQLVAIGRTDGTVHVFALAPAQDKPQETPSIVQPPSMIEVPSS